MVRYEDLTHTLLINEINIQYDCNSTWHKFLKSSLRNPHSFVYPDKISFDSTYRSAELDHFNSSFLSKGYNIYHIDKLNNDGPTEKGDTERFLFEIEKYGEKKLKEDEDVLRRKIVYLFKESMHYFMSFNEHDDIILDKFRNISRKDIKPNSDYELFKSLNDCIVQLHDSRELNNQVIIMTSDFCGLFSPISIKLTKYSDSFKSFLKESAIAFCDLFEEELKNNDFYKKKRERFEELRNADFVPQTKGELSLTNRGEKKVVSKSTVQKSGIKSEKELTNTNLNAKIQSNVKSDKHCIDEEEKAKEEEIINGTMKNEEDKSKNKKKKKKKEAISNPKERKRRKKGNAEEKAVENETINEKNNVIKVDDEEEEESLCLEDLKENVKENAVEEKNTSYTYENEELNKYLNINQKRASVGNNMEEEPMGNDMRMFHMLNKKMDPAEYVYREVKNDFMKEINLPNKYNYDVNIIEIPVTHVKKFYRCVAQHIANKKEKLKVYYIIANFVFFYCKMFKNDVVFHENVHKDINRNFDYKSITIQGNILPRNFYSFLEGLHIMNTYNLVSKFYLNVNYDERKNKCLHFLNITENKFYENFIKFENSIRAKFSYIHRFLKNIIPINKFTFIKGELYINSEGPVMNAFMDNDTLQLTYETNNANNSNNNEIVIYNEENENGVVASKGSVGGVDGSFQYGLLSNFKYILYVSNNVQKSLLNMRNYFKIFLEKDSQYLMNELANDEDNQMKSLLKESKILFLIDIYEKSLFCQQLLRNAVFYEKFISLTRIFYINTYLRTSEKVKHIPLFKPSFIEELVKCILKKKKEKMLKTKKKGPVLHTVDKLCNSFFKESFNKILNTKLKDGDKEHLEEAVKEQDDLKQTIDDLKKNSENTLLLEREERTEEIKYLMDMPEFTKEETSNTEEEKKEVDNTYEEGKEASGKNNVIISATVERKKNYEQLIVFIFVFINEHKETFTEEEKEIRELILYVLKDKENSHNEKIKYSFKYRNTIQDALTSIEIEIRKNMECIIYAIGIVLTKNISNPDLQNQLLKLYNLNEVMQAKYHSKHFEIIPKIVTYYWIYEVYTYGTIFLKNFETYHLLKNENSVLTLPYITQWEDRPLWGYYIYIIKDPVKSRYTEDNIERMRREQGVHLRMCSEYFDVSVLEKDLKDIFELHNLKLQDLKHMDGQDIYLNIVVLVENGHLSYFSFNNTDLIEMDQRHCSITIQIFKSKISFPASRLFIPILDDKWLIDVIRKGTVLPYDNYLYTY